MHNTFKKSSKYHIHFELFLITDQLNKTLYIKSAIYKSGIKSNRSIILIL